MDGYTEKDQDFIRGFMTCAVRVISMPYPCETDNDGDNNGQYQSPGQLPMNGLQYN